MEREKSAVRYGPRVEIDCLSHLYRLGLTVNTKSLKRIEYTSLPSYRRIPVPGLPPLMPTMDACTSNDLEIWSISGTPIGRSSGWYLVGLRIDIFTIAVDMMKSKFVTTFHPCLGLVLHFHLLNVPSGA